MTEWPAILWGIDDVSPVPIVIARGTMQECLSQWPPPKPWRYQACYEDQVPNTLLNELARRELRSVSGFLRPDFSGRYRPHSSYPWLGDRFACRDCDDTSITDRILHDRWHGDGPRVNDVTRAILADQAARLGEICAALFGDD
jgi:hypothetical protein